MARVDKALDALRPTNSIESVRLPEPVRPSSPTVAPVAVVAQPSTTAAKKPGPHTTESAAISNSYYVEDRGRERHFYDDYQRKALAMRATDTVVSSKRQDLNTIKAMFEVADTRGWKSVELKGTAEFKREAWIEAQTRGLEARGYRATDLDRQEAERRGRERGQSNEVRTAAIPTAPAVDVPVQPVKEAGKASPVNESPIAPKVDEPSVANYRKSYRSAQADLSPDGRLVLSALTETVDRQMTRQTNLVKAEIKSFVATELLKKEWAEGPVVLSAEQKRAATAPEPAREVKAPERGNTRRIEPETPRRSLTR